MSVSFFPDGDVLLTGMRNGDILVWNARTGELQTTVNLQTGCVKAPDAPRQTDRHWPPTGIFVLAAGTVGDICILRLVNPEPTRQRIEAKQGEIACLVLSPCGRYFASARLRRVRLPLGVGYRQADCSLRGPSCPDILPRLLPRRQIAPLHQHGHNIVDLGPQGSDRQVRRENGREKT